MFISKHRLERTLARIDELEKEVRLLQRKTSVYVADDGVLQGWEGSNASIVDAMNALAASTNFRWKQIHAQPPGLEAVKK